MIRAGWNWRKKQKTSSRDIWERDRTGKEAQEFRQTKMKIVRIKRTGESNEVETVSRINRTDSKIIATRIREKERRNGVADSKMT